MKAFYLSLAVCCFVLVGFSQPTDGIVKIIPRSFHYQLPGLLNSQTQPDLLLSSAKLIGVKKNVKVYSLALDNMPCLVPDLKNIAPMPVKKLLVVDPTMPNKFLNKRPLKEI